MLQRQNRFLSFILFSGIILSTYTNCAKPIHSQGSGLSSSADLLESGFKCENPAVSSSSESYILTKKQYQNTIEDLFGAIVFAASKDKLSTIFEDTYNPDTYKRLSTISSSQLDAYMESAMFVAATVVDNSIVRTKVFSGCVNVVTPTATCIDSYLNGFATKILRRPLSTEEKVSAKEIMNTAGDYKENLKAILAYHLMSPHFLWRVELGAAQQTSAQQIVLTNYEVASRIAFMLTDSTPDDALLAAAAAGSLLAPEGLRAEVRRLLGSARGKAKIVNNLLRWSGSDLTHSLASLPAELTNGIVTSGLESAMTSEARAFIEHTVFDQKGSFKDLLTSKLSFANHAGLAKIYGHSAIPVGGAPVELTERRQGLLMKAGGWTWSSPRTNIILRGVAFQKKFLCNEIPSPTVDISSDRDVHILTEDDLITVTNRSAVTYQTDAPVCMSCHTMINPAGFALESMDSLGRLRSREMIFDRRSSNSFVRDLPIHSVASVPFSSRSNVEVQDTFDMIDELANSPRGSACFSRTLFRYAYEKKESSKDDCQLTDVHNVLKDPTKSILDGLETLIVNRYAYIKEL